ncbi:hypothetical protein JRC04_06610 [Mycolicibacterium sp. S2-37]|uniref:hypothetical protein n=1 Tax=Mycolicibacterium sp. S2-37 TaxID=2810297 RepID=UPI001A93F6C0|nr:hypothetical protein [Mycolicibacterium sp. S2-37]MBO0677131.1 hypothetical protein [Mycolicibacterium sp. S2-37]
MATARKVRNVGRHRAEELPVRRWLQLGAASAGVGAALLGWSLVGSEVGVAAADGVEGSSSTSAGPAASPSRGVDSGPSTSPSSDSAAGADSGSPSSSPRRSSRTAADESGDDAPSQVVARSNRTAAESSSVGDRLTNSTSVSSRLASRTAATAAAPAASSSPFSSLFSAFTPKPAPAQPNQQPGAKVTFEFNYTTGAELWTEEQKRGLEDAANTLASTYFIVDRPVTLTYTVTADKNPDKLASAGSEDMKENPGFNTVVVQEKLLTGLDINGPQNDGVIEWSFFQKWNPGPKPTDQEYDLTSTAMHELLHSFGWLTFTQYPVTQAQREWSVYDSFIVDDNGTRAVDSDYTFREALYPNLIGWNGGLYFDGANAVAAYGKPVPLFTPDPWEGGSSLSHLDDYTFTRANGNFQMMTSADIPGPGPKTLSRIEQGVLADLGYNIRFQDPAPYAPVYGMTLVGFLFLRRKKRPASEEN